MRRMVRWTTAAAAAAVMVIAATVPAAAGDSGDDFSFLVSSAPTDQVEPNEYVSPGERAQSELDHRFIQMTLDVPNLEILSTAVGSEDGDLILYSAASAEFVAATLKDYGLTDQVEYRPAALSASELNATIRQLTGDYGILPTGQQIAMVIPSQDATRLEVVLDEQTKSRSALRMPDIGIPIDVSYGPMPDPATRNVAPSTQYPQRFSGAYMQNGTFACTTGFRFTQTDGSNTPAMGSADHCGADTGGAGQWYYSSLTSWPIGTYWGGLYPGPAAYGDTALFLGTGTAQMIPGVLVGDNTAAGSTLSEINGARATSIGAYVCYSGSRSGTMCNNLIENVNVSACYGGVLPCYYNLAATSQVGGQPAVGQGDSGGPAISQGGNGRFAMGIISGMTNASQSCTGDGGRLCSSTVLYAPVTEFFGAGWGLNYYPL